jgi:hypothetical protein
MIFEFLFPILGWLIVFGAMYFVYNAFFYRKSATDAAVAEIEGQSVFSLISAFFWIVVYMCLSSIWSILYTLIDLKFPDIIGAPSDYGNSGLSLSGAVYDAMAFPLATLVVCAVTSVILAFWIISRQKANPALRPDKLYQFIRFVTFVGGAILAFSGFVYVVYAWLYGSLPMAVFLKGLVAFVIVGTVAAYFYLVAGKTRNNSESLIGRVFALFLFVAMLVTLFVSFNVVGTPKEARKYRLDALKLQDLQSIKYQVDARDEQGQTPMQSLSDIKDEYVKNIVKRNEKAVSGFRLVSGVKDYKLCANFVSNMPVYVNSGNNSDDTWNYTKGETCFTFDRRENMNIKNINLNEDNSKDGYVPEVNVN